MTRTEYWEWSVSPDAWAQFHWKVIDLSSDDKKLNKNKEERITMKRFERKKRLERFGEK
jgi:hypothetical protein